MRSAAFAAPSLTDKRVLETGDRSSLIEHFRRCRDMGNEWLRRQIINNRRIDILAGAVLGFDVRPFHLRMLQFQMQHPDNLQLCFRGAGKSSMCTITKGIHLLLCDPNLRILIASKTTQNAEGFLKEIKTHFESNQLLIELFGEYYDPRRVNKWDNREIEVLPRTKPNKEASITCVGVDGTIVSKHYDVILADDLVDEENARTKNQREKTRTWYYQTLDPTLEPPDASIPYRGQFHRLGTRYHYDDLYGHLIANELAEHHNIIPALDEHGRSPWPEKYPSKWFAEKKRKSGVIIFNAQYQCDTEAMKGEIFQYDNCVQIEESEIPDKDGLRIFMGVDLAISEDEKNDHFAIVVIGVTKDKSAYYVLDHYDGQIRFSKQTSKIIEFSKRWDPIRIGIETNAYQLAQYQNVKDTNPNVRLRRVNTIKDKVTRAWKLSPLLEDNRVFFRKGRQNDLIEQLVLFPNHKFKDLFDALDLAVTASKLGRRHSTREFEPGLI